MTNFILLSILLLQNNKEVQMKVFEIQHPNNNSLVTVKNIEGVSLVTETENFEYAEQKVKYYY